MNASPFIVVGDMLAIEDAIVTIDAMGCQRNIAQKILDKKADCIFSLKGDQAQPEDLRLYQVHQREQCVQPPTMNGAVAALRFFFTKTCNRPEMARHLTLVRQPQNLAVVLTLAVDSILRGWWRQPFMR